MTPELLGFHKGFHPTTPTTYHGYEATVFLSDSRRQVVELYNLTERLFAIVPHFGVSLYFSRDTTHIPEVMVKCAP